ncbi:hypothetical protein WMY93_022223 [Mugilogobius chulae]|uniref:Ig-like domain-containing protein n=1 Tax=Mugilogobius chulae TaxID=88201 RepID=A0AAW0N6D2_9GOBI
MLVSPRLPAPLLAPTRAPRACGPSALLHTRERAYCTPVSNKSAASLDTSTQPHTQHQSPRCGQEPHSITISRAIRSPHQRLRSPYAERERRRERDETKINLRVRDRETKERERPERERREEDQSPTSVKRENEEIERGSLSSPRYTQTEGLKQRKREEREEKEQDPTSGKKDEERREERERDYERERRERERERRGREEQDQLGEKRGEREGRRTDQPRRVKRTEEREGGKGREKRGQDQPSGKRQREIKREERVGRRERERERGERERGRTSHLGKRRRDEGGETGERERTKEREETRSNLGKEREGGGERERHRERGGERLKRERGREDKINLGFNSISEVSEKSFSGLKRLELLLIHGNNLHSVSDGAFKDLASLQMLKLSYNKLREVNRHTFRGLWSLARLHLDHNGLESLDPDTFHGLTNLKLLQLEGNRLKRIHAFTFSTFTTMGRFHLSTLKHLYLSNNSLSALPRETVESMPQLENLYLHANPWVCDCDMEWVHTWVQTTPDVGEVRAHLRESHECAERICRESIFVGGCSGLIRLSIHNTSILAGIHLRERREKAEGERKKEKGERNGEREKREREARKRERERERERERKRGEQLTYMSSIDKKRVLKCKKDRALPGGQLCPICSSPRNLRQKPLHLLENMICSSPVIDSKDQPRETDNELTFLHDFKQPFGNISLELSDEHGNNVELECGIDEPKDASKISFEQTDDSKMASNITLSLDLDCDVDRERYEHLWRLIAYYTSVPAHLKRGMMLTKDPFPTYVYKQDSDKDALYYTGVKANIMAQPSWLMQTYTDLQLNRQGSSAKKVKLSFTTQLSQNLEAEVIRRQARTWVMIEEASSKYKTAILGKTFDLKCNVQSSGEPVITWILPDGTKLAAPSDNFDQKLSISADGTLRIKMATHKDAGNYYCVAKVDEDIAILSFYVSVQDSSNPEPGKDQATPTEVFVGNSLSLNCDAYGSPNPEVNWIIPNGNIVSFKSNTSRVFVYANGTLHIPQSLPPDDGFYKCVALNPFGVDTRSAKVVVNKRPGVVRTLRRFPLRPQSASGVNTKVKVKEFEEGSGDIDEIIDAKPIRKIVPIRNSMHPSRTPWRRPSIMLRKPNLQNSETGRNILDSRRRMSMAKTKINPERWADILSKIRIKNGQFATTAAPVTSTTPK